MKFTYFVISILISIGTTSADDHLSWLRESPVKKQTVISSSQGQVTHRTRPSAAWKVSSKDSRKRTMTIDNKVPAVAKPGEPIQRKAIPVQLEVKDTSSKKTEEKTEKTPAQFDPAELTPEQLNAYIASLEVELAKLNSETPLKKKSPPESSRGVLSNLKSNAEIALLDSNSESLKSEFSIGGASMSDTHADRYLQRLLKTISVKN